MFGNNVPSRNNDDSQIPKNVRELIANIVDSMVVLEVLLLFYRHPEQEWREEDVAKQLCVSRPGMELRLPVLAKFGLLTRQGGPPHTYRYYPASIEINAAVAALARAYTQRPQNVIALIHSRPHRISWRFTHNFWFPPF